MAKNMNKVAWRGWKPVIRRIPDWATFPWGMVDIFREYGLQAKWKVWSSRQELLAKLGGEFVLMPVIGSWRPLWSHVMTLVAWDSDRGWGFANTQRERGVIDWLAESAFLSQWKAIGRILVWINY